MNTVPTRIGCSACGTSPVNHKAARIINILDETIEKISKVLLERFQLSFTSADDKAFVLVTRFFHLIGLVRYSTDETKAASGRSELIWNEAIRRGTPMEQLIFVGKPIEQYRAFLNGQWFYFQSLPIPPWLSQKGYAWVDDKHVLAQKLESIGIPSPKTRLVTSWENAVESFEALEKPVIIKPRIGSRGRHTTTNITTVEQLRSAYDLAKQIARELVLEEHLFGSVCRATVVDGKLVGFFRADPPRVVGDGVRTVDELIEAKNAVHDERLGKVVINDDLLSYIDRAGYALDSSIPDGVSLDLSAKTGRFYGGITHEMLPDVHPKMHELFERAARLVDAPVAGFDLITTDPTSDPDTLRWGIIECNSLPFIDLHYYAYHGEPNDISKYVWDLWQK